jgi:hypothetical protein
LFIPIPVAVVVAGRVAVCSDAAASSTFAVVRRHPVRCTVVSRPQSPHGPLRDVRWPLHRLC